MEPTVSPATVRAILAYAAHRCIPIGIEPRESRYPFSEVADLWSRVERISGDTLVGRRAAQLAPFGAFGIVEQLMLLSETLERCVHRLVSFYPTVNEAFALTLRARGDSALIQLHACDGGKIQVAYADFVLTSIAKRIVATSGDRWPKIILRRDPSSPHLFFERAALRMQLPFADEELCEILQSVATRRLHDNQRKTTTQLVSEIVLHRLGTSAITLGDVAQALGVSPRTLQRQLIEEGTSYRAIVESSRRNIAARLLDRRMPAKGIAERTGFVEVRSFRRARRRWSDRG
ncbi:MAG: hypothetical protein DMF58_02575 [Acidobacteria bacterium]|nr:MAG: hypothetical protein DMF58_02575 [Acidobacteriota bacterium]